MLWQRVLVIIALFFAGFIAAVLAIFAYQRRRQTGAKEFSALMASLVVYAFSYGFQLSGNTLSQVLLWDKVADLGFAFIPLLWIMLAACYSGLSKWRRSSIFHIMLPVSIVFLMLDFTNEFHHLYYCSIKLQTDSVIPILTYILGPGGLAYRIYLYTSLFGGNILLIDALARTAKPYRSQIYIIICGTLVSWLGNIIYILGLSPYRLDLSPFAFMVSGLIFAWGIFRHKLLDLAPIAREVVFENMRDGVLVLDWQNRIVDYNPKARDLLTELIPAAIGRDIKAVFGTEHELTRQIRDRSEQSRFTIGQVNCKRFIDSRISLILSKSGAPIGRNVILTDITLQQEAQIRLIQSEKSAVLGQLVANVVHEMNTPLAAIKATSENIEQSFGLLRPQLLHFSDGLSDSQKRLFMEIIAEAQMKPALPASLKKEALKKLIAVLQEREMEAADDIARSFIELGIADKFEHFLPLIKDDTGRTQLRLILEIAMQRQKIGLILTEEEKAAKIVHTLKSYLHPSN